MSFRRSRDDWDEFLSRYRAALLECGIPEKIIRNELRFFMFLEHGFDKWEWKSNPRGLFQPADLTDEQNEKFARFVSRHIGPHDKIRVASRWQRLA